MTPARIGILALILGIAACASGGKDIDAGAADAPPAADAPAHSRRPAHP